MIFLRANHYELKALIKRILQGLLGFERYLRVFANFKIRTLHLDRKEAGFFHFLHKIDDDGLLLDVGANIGVMTYFLSTRFPHSSVISFEPVQENLATLNYVIQKHGLKNVEVKSVAVGDESGELEMVMPAQQGIRMHGLSHVKNAVEGDSRGQEYRVEQVMLDSLLNDYPGQKVVAIKIDIENYEHRALLGGKEMLQKHKPLIYIELWDNKNRDDCFELLKSLGYVAYVPKGKELILWQDGVIDSQYFIFAPASA